MDNNIQTRNLSEVDLPGLENDMSAMSGGGGTDNSLVQSPSIESFSTIQDVETIDLNMDMNPHFYVKIANPEKQLDMMETYITFQITTRVNKEGYSLDEYVVRRRYNDFLWLRQQLLDSYPFCIVPPLPEKHSLVGQLDRYAKDFILLRMKSLNVFIKRICNHPMLSNSDQLKGFLTTNAKDFSAHKNQKRLTNNHSSLKSLNTSEHSESSHSDLQKSNLEFDKIKSYLNILNEKLSNFDKISHRITKEKADLVTELNSLHPVFSTLANIEPELRTILEPIGGAVEKNAKAQEAVSHSDPMTMATSVREFLQYIEVVQMTLKKRDSVQYSYETSLEELNKRKADKEKLLAISQENSYHSNTKNEDKLQKLVSTIPQLSKKSELDQERLEVANEVLKKDLELWQEEKKGFLKKMLMEFVNRQINCFQTSVGAWEEVTNHLSLENNIGENSSNTK